MRQKRFTSPRNKNPAIQNSSTLRNGYFASLGSAASEASPLCRVPDNRHAIADLSDHLKGLSAIDQPRSFTIGRLNVCFHQKPPFRFRDRAPGPSMAATGWGAECRLHNSSDKKRVVLKIDRFSHRNMRATTQVGAIERKQLIRCGSGTRSAHPMKSFKTFLLATALTVTATTSAYACQSACKRDPRSARKRDPLARLSYVDLRRQLALCAA